MKSTEAKEIDCFLTTLQEQFALIIQPGDIGVKATEMGIDEVDPSFVPMEFFEETPTTLLYETMVVEDSLDNLWVGAVAFYPHTYDWCLQVTTKNDDVVLRNVLPFIE